MTPFHHPSRVQMASGHPCWLGLRAVLPDMGLRPTSPALRANVSVQYFTAFIMVPTAEPDGTWDGAFGWEYRDDLTSQKIGQLMLDWEASPEEALRVWFGHVLPKPRHATFEPSAPNIERSHASAADLDL